MAIGAPPNPVIDTRPIPLAGRDSQGQGPSLESKGEHDPRSFTKSSVIPAHSSLPSPSPLSPPLSVSPPSFGSTMAQLVASHSSPTTGTFSNASLPPLPPSSELIGKHNHNSNDSHGRHSSDSNRSDRSSPSQHLIARGGLTNTTTGPSTPYMQTSPEQWLAHAAEQRRHLSAGSLSSLSSRNSSTARLSPDRLATCSPARLEFGESERVQSDGSEDNDQEPEINVNMRPSELRASLMARARRSSAKVQQQQEQLRGSAPMSISLEKGSRLSAQSNHSLSSAFESNLSTRSSRSSISGWAPRARSDSLSSESSNGSVNLDALIADGSDINEECPLELEEGDDVEWTKIQQQQQQQQQQQYLFDQTVRSRSTTIGSDANMLQYDDHGLDEYWEGSDMIATEDDEEFGETLREFSQLTLKSSSTEVRGLAGQRRHGAGAGSTRFPDGRNPFDLETDYVDNRHSGLRTVSSRNSTQSNYSNASDRSSVSRLPAPGTSRIQGPASGIKAPPSRLARPQSALVQPKSITPSAAAARSGLARPSGLQPPKTGSQAARSGLQPPRAASVSSLPTRGSSLTKPTAGRTGANSNGIRAAPGSSLRAPSKPSTGQTRSSTTTKSQIATPGSVKRTTTSISNRHSLLPAPSSVSLSRVGSSKASAGRATANSSVNSPKRSSTQPTLLNSPTRVPASRQASSSHLVSPTSSHSSTSSLTYGGKDTVASLSHGHSNATSTMRPRTMTSASGRSVSMYGSSALLHQQQEDYGYSVLTPPQSPSSKIGSRTPTGLPRSGLQTPSSLSSSRLVAPTVSTSRIGRSGSPSPLSAGSSSGNFSSRPHTPTLSQPVSRYSSGLVSPRAGRN